MDLLSHTHPGKYYFWLFFILLLAACSAKKDSGEKEPSETIVLIDDLKREVVLSRKPQKVMALAPSMTEMLFFVCDTSQIVAVTQNCNYPEAVKTKPIVNNYPMDFEGLLKVKPDLVFTIEGMTPQSDAERMKQMGIPVYYQKYATVDDVLDGLADIAKIMDREELSRSKIDSLRNLKNTVIAQTQFLPKPSVLAITWQDPIYAYGKNTILTNKLQLAGAINAIDTVFDNPYPALSREYILKINPDIILGGTFNEMDSSFFKLYPELKKIKAYQNKRIYKVTDDLNSRPSPRVIEAVIELKKYIHPEAK
ncbi:ABC transporter substrate-binding protein [Rhodocytophaga rosea]|uniref:ABC transporter substrate-binding protein n=1 Tax=Rhodocytophaga rosea TaxID=2704465 RepID=A0A6C0GKX3_9BACT|nr:ABC transporter substrate-binding protein [Rhodocytophaga rosea]QHT68731.1 ABC transporter substrate-binding protein [Rhodocytophaga rosea]